MKKLIALTLAVLALTTTNAAELRHRDNTGWITSGSINATLRVPKFSPSLGTLTGVLFLTRAIHYSAAQDSALPVTATADWEWSLNGNPLSAYTTSVDWPIDWRLFPHSNVDEVDDYYTEADIPLSEFTGGGNVTVDVEAQESNLPGTSSTMQARIDVIYYYVPAAPKGGKSSIRAKNGR